MMFDCITFHLDKIQKVVLSLGDYLKVRCHACIGGTNVMQDIKQLDQGNQILVGTPGRVFDMIQRGKIGM